jgi:hypothetical protein
MKYFLVILVLGLTLWGQTPKTASAVGAEQNFAVLLKRVDSLMVDYNAASAAIDRKRANNDTSGYSASQRVHQELVAAFESAGKEARESADAWIELAKRAPEIVDRDTRIRTAEKAVQLRSNSETLLLLGQALKSKYASYPFSKSDADRAGLERASTVLRSAGRLSASKNPLILYELGDCLAWLYKVDEAEAQLQLASTLVPNNDKDLKKRIANGLIMTAYLSRNKQLMESRFSEFVDSGFADRWDWSTEAIWLQNLKDYVQSGETFLKAAALFNEWTFTCQSADSFQPPPLDAVRLVPPTGRRALVYVEHVVAKAASACYTPDATTWVKIKNRHYSQAVGRHDFFDRRRARMG